MFKEILDFLIFTFVLIALALPLGHYIAKIFRDEKTFLHPILGWLERLCYRIAGVNPKEEMAWNIYARRLIGFNLLGMLFLFLLLIFQNFFPLNPQEFPNLSWPLAFNIASSFITNTDWQSYAGETTLSYFTQMVGLASQNFLSAATGLSVLMAFIRGIIQNGSKTIGNFWSDLVRSIVYILLPLSLLTAIFLLTQGVIQTFSPYVEVSTLEGSVQTIPLGPVASQVAIKQLGSNGGGFFNVNSAHPFENPTFFSNFVELLAILLIPVALIYTYSLLIESKKHGLVLGSVMLALFLIGLATTIYSYIYPNPNLNSFPALEGKEARFGLMGTQLWTVSSMATGNGSVNSMMSSASPLSGGIPIFYMLIGELVFGAVGVGLKGMLMYVLLAVFLVGLMVGRTPEYLGKKIEVKEIQWIVISVLMPTALVLLGTSLCCLLPAEMRGSSQEGPHAFTEILYALSSVASNNGSSFASLNTNTNYYNFLLGIIMLIGRWTSVIPSLAVAGLLAKKRRIPPSAGVFSTNSLLFGILLFSVIALIGMLSLFPFFSLGPLAEFFLMKEARVF